MTLFLFESSLRHTNHNRSPHLNLSLTQLQLLLLLVWAASLPVVKAQQGLIQNVTVSSADPRIQYTPTNEWLPAVVTNSNGATTVSFMQTSLFNASVAFNITGGSQISSAITITKFVISSYALWMMKMNW
jgi:hypothetical protein